MYFAFLSIHTLTVSILVCYHFKNHLSPCNNLTFFTDIKNKNDLCHILDFLKCLFMLILLFSCGSKFTTKSTMQENSHTNISLHFSECQISPSLLFCFYSIYKFNQCHDLWKALLNFLLILFLCNTFIKKKYFHFFFHIYQMRLRIFIEIFACDFISCMVVWTVEPHVCIWMVYISYSNTFSLPFFSFCSMELHKTLTLDPSSSTQNTTPTLTSVQSQHAPMAIPISQLAMKPFPIVGYNGINGIAGLNGINGLNGLNVPVIDSVAAANQKNLTTKMRVGLTSVRADPKFSPYWWL